MDDKTKKELSDIIIENVTTIFKTMFGVEVRLIDEYNASFDDDDMVVKVILSQNGLEIVIRFAFTRDLLVPLLKEIYDPIMAQQELVLEDAVCEISNIVCSGLKKHLNETNYNLDMSLPIIDYGFQTYDGSKEDCLNISFILQDCVFLVDFVMKRDIEKKELP